MERENAKKLAEEYLARTIERLAGKLVILDKFTVETPQYYVFFYQHRKWVEERDVPSRLVGNLPVAVDKNDAWVHEVPHGDRIEDRLAVLHEWRTRRGA